MNKKICYIKNYHISFFSYDIFLSSYSKDSNIYNNLENESEEVVEANFANLTLKDEEDIINNEEIELAGGGPMEVLKRDFLI